jgi:ribosome-binding ATPase YchF (GTP1/OBG family)
MKFENTTMYNVLNKAREASPNYPFLTSEPSSHPVNECLIPAANEETRSHTNEYVRREQSGVLREGVDV